MYSENLVTKIIYNKLISPKYYNYSTDIIDVNIEFSQENIDNIYKIIKENQNEFDTYIKDNYTSYDGFMSNYSNDPALFVKDFIQD